MNFEEYLTERVGSGPVTWSPTEVDWVDQWGYPVYGEAYRSGYEQELDRLGITAQPEAPLAVSDDISYLRSASAVAGGANLDNKPVSRTRKRENASPGNGLPHASFGLISGCSSG